MTFLVLMKKYDVYDFTAIAFGQSDEAYVYGFE